LAHRSIQRTGRQRNFRSRAVFCCGYDGGLLERTMHGIIYLVGLIVVIMAILSFFGLR
jgi:hypothetical protein